MPQKTASLCRSLALAQLVLALTLLPMVALWPRVGMALLMLPLPGHAAQASLWARQQGLRITGRGLARGSLILTGTHGYTPFSALGAGALIIAAPAALCRSAPLPFASQSTGTSHE